MAKHLKISNNVHKRLSEFQDKEEIKTFDGAIRILLERYARDEKSR